MDCSLLHSDGQPICNDSSLFDANQGGFVAALYAAFDSQGMYCSADAGPNATNQSEYVSATDLPDEPIIVAKQV